jgi:hypothetical protein
VARHIIGETLERHAAKMPEGLLLPIEQGTEPFMGIRHLSITHNSRACGRYPFLKMAILVSMIC